MSTEKIRTDVLVIGGGAAGLMASIFAAKNGAKVLLAEKNEKVGKKLYITGKGRCNVTNACGIQDFLTQVPQNPRFLYSALHHFSPDDMIALLEENGCPTKVERGRRVFPVSDKASDVSKALLSVCSRLGVRIMTNTLVSRLLIEENHVTGAELASGESIRASAVIIATGGMSYPLTGSTGDGYRFAKEAGHNIVSCVPSLIPFITKEDWPKSLQGLSLKNVTLTACSGKKELYSELGEMLFTHFGVSGPLFIELSSHVRATQLPLTVTLDLKPGLTNEQLSARLLREFSASGKKMLKSVLVTLLPQRLAEIFPMLCNISGNKCVSQITQAERDMIVSKLKALPITLTAFRPIEEAIVTRGGVSTDQISAKDMQSKLVSGLYFAGEFIDVDAHTGGYNLQIAFSTGALAGENAAKQVLENVNN